MQHFVTFYYFKSISKQILQFRKWQLLLSVNPFEMSMIVAYITTFSLIVKPSTNFAVTLISLSQNSQ